MGVLNVRVHCKLRVLTVKHFSSSAPLKGTFIQSDANALKCLAHKKACAVERSKEKRRSDENTYTF